MDPTGSKSVGDVSEKRCGEKIKSSFHHGNLRLLDIKVNDQVLRVF